GRRGYNPVSHTSLGLGGITRGLEIWKPMIAAINGFCLAGGLEQALACDLRIAAPHARFGLTEVRWAIMPGAGGTQRLPRAVPLARAAGMILTAEPIPADEALRLGLINKGLPLPGLMPAAPALPGPLAQRAPLAGGACREGGDHPRAVVAGRRRSPARGAPGRDSARDRGRRGRPDGVRRKAQADVQGAMTVAPGAVMRTR